jgi:hypothetical protein
MSVPDISAGEKYKLDLRLKGSTSQACLCCLFMFKTERRSGII